MKFLFLFFVDQELKNIFLNEQIPEAIIYLQILLFVLWFAWLVKIWRNQRKLRSIIKLNEGNSSTLIADLSNGSDKGDTQILTDHLKAIWNAGQNGASLDIPLLVKNTQDELNSAIAFLRSVLSLFLVLGLLGTLFGLAISLSKFSVLANGEMTIDMLKQNLQILLENLGGAFIPSICGVFITVVGVLLFSFFQRHASVPLGNLIERKTLTEWVPDFIKNSQEKDKNHILQLNYLIQEHVRLAKENEEAVHGFKQVAETFKTEAGDLATNVESASKTLRVLKQSSENLKGFSEKFVESVTHITSFQEELKNIYLQNTENSRKFATTVTSILDGNSKFQYMVSAQFREQSAESKQLFERLKLYEEGYLQSRQNIDENLNRLLIKSTETNEKIGSQNAETVEAVVSGLVGAVGSPLQERLVESLKAVSTDLDRGLNGISQNLSENFETILTKIEENLHQISDKHGETTAKFEEFVTKLGEVKIGIDSINLPLGDAAMDIRGIAMDFDNRTKKLLTNLHGNFETQNVTTQEQLMNLTGLKENVANLSMKFDALGSKIDLFSEAAGNLEQTLNRTKEIKVKTYSPNTITDQIKSEPTRWQRVKNIFRRNKN